MEPVRVRLYGFLSLTRRRYVTQAVTGVVAAVVVLVGWYFAWPPLRERLTRPDLPPSAYRDALVAVMGNVPWILLAALAYQAAECVVVLRLFARKERRRAGERGASAP